MIKLDRAEKPTYLTDQKVTELTQEYIKDGKSVWNNNNIKTPLLNSSNNKCAYCECILTKESNYMEVEHFEDKSHNPDKVVLWENLLPSCKKCNGKKGTHDVLNEPIVNPYIENPKDHFVMRLYRMRGKTDRGINSIDVYGLNHSSRLVFSRFEIGEKISELISTSWDRVNTYENNKNTRSKNKLIDIYSSRLSFRNKNISKNMY
ncbi:hypothetical protein MNBD_GAMMA12-2132 [hydrothermal vent metagenome]|uniref:HNH nuclease domain-containing protein n=1 Tax=hydrothermal vent metagenome TaxID=652676 RepID=A0A3B0YSH9_9ZZZZ